jgi:N6-adenosine-specific RNA methylase IME4
MTELHAMYDVCSGCGCAYNRCGPAAWIRQRKCCPDCSHMPPARVLLADPPWKFGDKLGKRGAAANYQCLTLDELKAFPLPPLADDCLLMLWRVSAMQREALDVAEAWGFTVKSEIVWEKLTRSGKRHFGMGRYVRLAHEVCLLGTRGRVQIADHSIRSIVSAPVLEHSRKPDEVYAIAERLVPTHTGAYVELFARRRWPGWYAIGDELAAHAQVSA